MLNEFMGTFWFSKYYQIGNAIGQVAAFAVASLILRSSFFQFLVTPSILVAIMGGVLGSITTAIAFDKKSESSVSLKRTLFGFATIFAVGALVGSVINFFSNGSLLQPQFGFSNEIRDWFFKPFFWLCLIGFPCSQMVAFGYFFALRKLKLLDTIIK